MGKNFLISAFCLLWVNFISAQTATVNENDLFSDTSSITKSSEIVNNIASKENNPKSTGLSGVITNALTGSANRDWFDGYHRSDLALTNYTVGNLMLDIRLPQGAKAFANFEAQYVPNTSSLTSDLRELFVDANIKKHVYLRMGKQVLQWGLCTLWNPTDLINVEKKLFIQKIGYREGAYGLKIHIPFGTVCNIYGFVDTKNASSVDSVACAGKLEFLVGSTEMAFSLWDKKSCNPVAGYDISTRLAGVDITGELAVSDGSNSYSLKNEDGVLSKEKSKDWQTRLCIDIGRDFDFLKISRALTITGSFYYNKAGYDNNMFSNTEVYQYKDSITVTDQSGKSIAQKMGTQAGFLYGADLYEQHNYSRYYAALFTSVNRIILSSLSGSFKTVANIPQKSFIVSGGLTYTSLNEFFAGFLINGYIGGKNTEYTYKNQALSLQVTAGVTF
jgi:hypothetical protein